MGTKDRDRTGGGTRDPGDHGELGPGMAEFGDHDSGLSAGNSFESIKDPLGRLLTGGRLVVAVVESGQTVQA